ncbi:Kiwa anti-phage protein KwaB-like domain-containing protein [Pseudomonas sp. WAC2]|uniref:Kiwa anti-phage protein KwaB-like domain-containing protein n=1 Tax=Pseudomonas sp. WAC2 TaxID=3055057 RepID=UPI0025AF2656|nr:Kiwa anti-phage protein KwaB-like domain-containing protein [Pseudomonas sp. WAC2]MDN3238055.1 DUF4868 domain-containing protein [Pseudomonas sp. WAC2]
MLTLFALTSDPAKRIVRFSLSQPVQTEFTEYLKHQESIFDDIEQEIEFDGKYKPDHGEMLYIENFDDIDDLIPAIENPLSIEEVEPTEDFFKEIKALFTGYRTTTGSVKVLLQNFDRRKIISTNGMSIFHSSNVYRKVDGIGLTIDHKLTATLENKRLKFFSFHAARHIFDLSEHYKLATDEDVTDFVASNLIQSVNTNVILEIADSWVRRKISLIQQSGILQAVPLNEIKAAAIEFNIPFQTEMEGITEVIVIPENKADLKRLLRFLDEDYYKSPLSKTNFISNSKRVADQST